MTKWQQIAEELREAARRINKVRTALPRDHEGTVFWLRLGHTYTDVDGAARAAERATEQAEVFVTNKEPTK